MNIATVLPYIQMGIAILLGVAILLQQRGTGLSATFGGGGGFYRTKRGFERTLFIATVALAALFILAGILNVLFSN